MMITSAVTSPRCCLDCYRNRWVWYGGRAREERCGGGPNTGGRLSSHRRRPAPPDLPPPRSCHSRVDQTPVRQDLQWLPCYDSDGHRIASITQKQCFDRSPGTLSDDDRSPSSNMSSQVLAGELATISQEAKRKFPDIRTVGAMTISNNVELY